MSPMQIHSLQLPSDEAFEFEENMVAKGFVLVLKNDPEELAPKEFIRRMTDSTEDLSGEEFIFIWKEQES